MKKVYILLYILISVCFLDAQSYNEFDEFYEEFENLSIRELMDRGTDFDNKKSVDTSLLYYSAILARDVSKMIPEERKMFCSVCSRVGSIYYEHCNYIKALGIYLTGLRVSEDDDYINGLTMFYNNIGNIYVVFKEFDRAKMYYDMSYMYCKKSGNMTHMSIILDNLIGASCDLKDYDRAKEYLGESIKLGSAVDLQSKYSTLVNVGDINFYMGMYDSALSFFKKSLNVEGFKRSDPKRYCNTLFNIGQAYLKSGKYDSAKYYFNTSYKMCEEYDMLDLLSNNCKSMSEVYEYFGDYKNALYFKNRYLMVHDSIMDSQKYGKVRDLQFLYEMDKVDKKMFVLNSEKSIAENKMKMQRGVLIAAIITLLVITGLLLFVYYQKKKLSQTYKDLFERNTEIVNSEKFNKKLRIEYEDKIKDKDAELEELRSYIGVLKVERHIELESDEYPDEKTKYQTSSLNENQKLYIKQSIDKIMEDTDEFYDSDFTIEKLALLIGTNSKYVSQIINESYGRNFTMFVNEYKIREARKLLTDDKYSNYTIEFISEKVGFKSKTTFNPIFKKITGVTPSMYQKMYKKSRNLD